MAASPVPALVLVHSPLVGPLTWARAAESLRARGYPVVVPALGRAESGPPYYRRFAETAARAVTHERAEGPLVLVGHSGAGALLPAIAEAVEPGRVVCAVFVDALLPHPGSAWFDTVPPALAERLRELAVGGWLPPWHTWFPAEAVADLVPDAGLRDRFTAEVPRLPLAYFAEPAPEAPSWPPRAGGYVRLSAAYDGVADEAERDGWPVHRADVGHLGILTSPDLVADLVDSVVSG